ncbi:15020_t:CDS:2, partial [Dentiscutata heterogama]
LQIKNLRITKLLVQDNMTLRYELEQWKDAIKAYDEADFDRALDCFKTIEDNAKVHFNIGLIYATLGEHEEACRFFKKSVKLDQHFAVGYLKKVGICYLNLDQTEQGLSDLSLAAKEKQTEGHDVIDEAIQIQGQVLVSRFFSVPIGVLFRPPERKLYDVHVPLPHPSLTKRPEEGTENKPSYD